MAYSVDWLTKVVSIPQSDLALISAGVYELNVVDFWTEIHDIQDGEGITYDTIMRSNAPVTLAGQTYVRSVEIINGYSIEFEDGQYQVNLVGANNNLVDTRVANQVSLVGNNSAGAVVVSTGSGLSDEQDQTLTDILSEVGDAEVVAAAQSIVLDRLLDLAEADEELTSNVARLFKRGTTDVLLEKSVTGGRIVDVTLKE